MSIAYIDLKWPALPENVQTGGSRRQKKETLLIPVVLDLSALYQGAAKDVEFTLAPGSVASDVRQIACTTVRHHLLHLCTWLLPGGGLLLGKPRPRRPPRASLVARLSAARRAPRAALPRRVRVVRWSSSGSIQGAWTCSGATVSCGGPSRRSRR